MIVFYKVNKTKFMFSHGDWKAERIENVEKIIKKKKGE